MRPRPIKPHVARFVGVVVNVRWEVRGRLFAGLLWRAQRRDEDRRRVVGGLMLAAE